MFIHTLESLEEFEDCIKQLEETVGLTTETYKEVMTAISKERTKLKNILGSDSEQLKPMVFELANKLAIAGHGDEAASMHRIHNRL